MESVNTTMFACVYCLGMHYVAKYRPATTVATKWNGYSVIKDKNKQIISQYEGTTADVAVRCLSNQWSFLRWLITSSG